MNDDWIVYVCETFFLSHTHSHRSPSSRLVDAASFGSVTSDYTLAENPEGAEKSELTIGHRQTISQSYTFIDQMSVRALTRLYAAESQ